MCRPLTLHFLGCNHTIICGKQPCIWRRPLAPPLEKDEKDRGEQCAADEAKSMRTEPREGLCGRCEWKSLEEKEK
jgi:hypothetical protein